MTVEKSAISLVNLGKVYRLKGRKVVEAVNDLTFDVPAGRIFGFLGPNGAGKTTTIKMLVGFAAPTSGNASIFGVPIDRTESRRRIGYLSEQAYFHSFLTPEETLVVHASILGLPKREARRQIGELLDRVGIGGRARTPFGKLSKGMVQRVGLAVALIGSPDLLILDEPGSGLDPIGRRELRALLLDLKSEEKTIFLSSHLLSEVEVICDSVVMLNDGRLVALGPPETIKQVSPRLRITVAGFHGHVVGLPAAATVEADTTDGTTRVEVDQSEAYIALRALEALGAPLISAEACAETLEDAFVRMAA